MRNRIKAIKALAVLVSTLVFPLLGAGQASSLNTFSPYTMYGIGDLSTPGATDLLSMGGAGSALRTQYANRINFLNPAAYSNIGRQSFLLNFGLQGGGYYLKSETAKSSFNTFNIDNVSILFPLASRLGMAVSVSPVSSVGYRISTVEDDPSIVDELGVVRYDYSGEGGLSHIKAGVGYAITKKLSLGAEFIYLHGNIDRSYDVLISSYTNESKNNISSWENNVISRATAQFGVHYNAVMTDTRLLTLAAAWQPGVKLNPRVDKQTMPESSLFQDTIGYSSHISNFRMPGMVTVGAAWQTPKAALVADYTWQGWGGANSKTDLVNGNIRYRDVSSLKLGGEYTPNMLDVRNFMNRITYRAGVRVSNYYMSINGHDVTEKAVTLGVGIPMRRSSLNFGAEYGQRGSVKPGLIRENYVKFTIGLSLFGEDYWFVKPKYD